MPERLAWRGAIEQRFVVFEGLDGAGTTTQLQLLAARLAAAGRQCRATCEPTDGAIGDLIRGILGGATRVHPCTLAHLFAADRSEHVRAAETGILATLRQGSIVACDRYLFSSLAYQSLECPPEYVVALNRDFPLPRHLFFIDTSLEVCQQRVAARQRRELFDQRATQERLLASYARVLEQFQGSGVAVHRIDGGGDQHAVAARVWSCLEEQPILEA